MHRISFSEDAVWLAEVVLSVAMTAAAAAIGAPEEHLPREGIRSTMSVFLPDPFPEIRVLRPRNTSVVDAYYRCDKIEISWTNRLQV